MIIRFMSGNVCLHFKMFENIFKILPIPQSKKNTYRIKSKSQNCWMINVLKFDVEKLFLNKACQLFSIMTILSITFKKSIKKDLISTRDLGLNPF